MKPRTTFLALCLAAAGLAFQPASAEEITVAVGSGFTTLDPYDATDMLSRAAAKSFYEGLFTFDENMKPVPQLAQSCETSPDGLVYTIKLRPNVKFHDGTTLDAEAVKLNIDRLLDPANHLSRRTYFTPIEKVEVADPLTVRITLKHPLGTFLSRLANGTVQMVCPSLLKSGKNVAFNACGTGPYVLKDYNPS